MDAFIQCAERLGLKPQAPVALASLKDPIQRQAWIDQKQLVAFALTGAPGTPTVDVLLKHSLDLDAALDRQVVQNVSGVPVWIAAIEDMITLKRGTGRRQDEDDIEHLLRIRANGNG